MEEGFIFKHSENIQPELKKLLLYVEGLEGDVFSGDAISKSPLNKSKSKQMYSFPKARRFPKLRYSSSCTFYDIPSSLNKRATSFGMGKKYDFTKVQKGNNAQFYVNKSDFDQQKPYSSRFSFGVGRDKYEKVYYESTKMFDKYVPGPGKYDILKPFGYNSVKYSMSSRAKTIKETSLSPGPAEYTNKLQINSKGKYSSSSFSNVPQINMGSDRSQRSTYTGPSDYTQKSLIGSIYNSKYTSSAKVSIHQKLHPFSRNNNPGPGTYRYFSEFGIYESKNASLGSSKASRTNFVDS